MCRAAANNQLDGNHKEVHKRKGFHPLYDSIYFEDHPEALDGRFQILYTGEEEMRRV
jgi:hypothetical protein